jgi:leucyl aminopeptidase
MAINAQPTLTHQIIAPTCLSKHITAPHKTLASSSSFELMEMNEEGLNQLIHAKTMQKTLCGGFMDVSHAWQGYAIKHVTDSKKASDILAQYTKSETASLSKRRTYAIQYEAQVNQQLQRIVPDRMWKNLTHLTSFQDRYANSDNGVKAAEWLKSTIEALAKENQRNDITVYLVQTGYSYKQPSVVVKFGDSNAAGVVIGGHMDTLSSSFENKPGADDDGSGTATVLEAATTLISSGMRFNKPIYFIWYAAEEMGLVGSQYVVADFKRKKIPVDAVMQLDMTGYAYKNDPTMWLVKDNVNRSLTQYLQTLISTYVKTPVQYTACGYACSDHASWNSAGYAASAPFESAFETYNPYIHSSNDTMNHLSLNHMTSFAKLAVAFAIELAEPVK